MMRTSQPPYQILQDVRNSVDSCLCENRPSCLQMVRMKIHQQLPSLQRPLRDAHYGSAFFDSDGRTRLFCEIITAMAPCTRSQFRP